MNARLSLESIKRCAADNPDLDGAQIAEMVTVGVTKAELLAYVTDRIASMVPPIRRRAAVLTDQPAAGRPAAEWQPEQDMAAGWLTSWMNDHGGEGKAGDIIAAARKDGIAQHTLQRARKRAHVITVKAGVRDGWIWRLEPGGAAAVAAAEVAAHTDRLTEWLRDHGGEATARQLLRSHVAGVRTSAQLTVLLDKYEQRFPGSVREAGQQGKPGPPGLVVTVPPLPGGRIVSAGDCAGSPLLTALLSEYEQTPPVSENMIRNFEGRTAFLRMIRLRNAVKQAGPAGLTRSDASALFGRHLPAQLLDDLLDELVASPNFERGETRTAGRPAETYRAVAAS